MLHLSSIFFGIVALRLVAARRALRLKEQPPADMPRSRKTEKSDEGSLATKRSLHVPSEVSSAPAGPLSPICAEEMSFSTDHPIGSCIFARPPISGSRMRAAAAKKIDDVLEQFGISGSEASSDSEGQDAEDCAGGAAPFLERERDRLHTAKESYKSFRRVARSCSPLRLRTVEKSRPPNPPRTAGEHIHEQRCLQKRILHRRQSSWPGGPAGLPHKTEHISSEDEAVVSSPQSSTPLRRGRRRHQAWERESAPSRRRYQATPPAAPTLSDESVGDEMLRHSRSPRRGFVTTEKSNDGSPVEVSGLEASYGTDHSEASTSSDSEGEEADAFERGEAPPPSLGLDHIDMRAAKLSLWRRVGDGDPLQGRELLLRRIRLPPPPRRRRHDSASPSEIASGEEMLSDSDGYGTHSDSDDENSPVEEDEEEEDPPWYSRYDMPDEGDFIAYYQPPASFEDCHVHGSPWLPNKDYIYREMPVWHRSRRAPVPDWGKSLALLSLTKPGLASIGVDASSGRAFCRVKVEKFDWWNDSSNRSINLGPGSEQVQLMKREAVAHLLWGRLSNDLAAEISNGLKSFQTKVRNTQEALDSLDVRAHVLEWLERRREMIQGQDAGRFEIVPEILSDAAIREPPEIIRTEEGEEDVWSDAAILELRTFEETEEEWNKLTTSLQRRNKKIEERCSDFIWKLYEPLHNDAVLALRDGDVKYSPDPDIWRFSPDPTLG